MACWLARDWFEIGGFVDGYMFFEHLSPRDARLTFEAVLSAPVVRPTRVWDATARAAAKSSESESHIAQERAASISIPLDAD